MLQRSWSLVAFVSVAIVWGCGGDDSSPGTGGGNTGGAASGAGAAGEVGGAGMGAGAMGGMGTGGADTGGAGTGGTGTGGMGTGGQGAAGGGGMSGGDAQQDDFEMPMLSSNWEVIFPPPPNSQVQIIDGSDLGMGPGPQGFFLVNWIGTTFADDQFCEATLPLDVNPNWIHQVYVRWRTSDGARYGFHYNGDPNQAGFGNWAFKYDGVPSAQTRVIAEVPATTVTPPVAGDTLRIEVQGYELRGYKNGVFVMSVTDTDATKIAGGRTGLAARWANGNQSTNTNVKVWESWAGGSL